MVLFDIYENHRHHSNLLRHAMVLPLFDKQESLGCVVCLLLAIYIENVKVFKSFNFN